MGVVLEQRRLEVVVLEEQSVVGVVQVVSVVPEEC